MRKYIYQHPEWPNFTWDEKKILTMLCEVKKEQGLLLGKLQTVGFQPREDAALQITIQEVVHSAQIEGQILNMALVRSSVARRLGITIAEKVETIDHNVEGIVTMALDATINYDQTLSTERLCAWQADLFPDGWSNLYKIKTGSFRDDEHGRMEIVSGQTGRQKIHYEAPEAVLVPEEMEKFLAWVNAENTQDYVLKAAIAHFWFVTIHPFEDGNGRIARAITDYFMCKGDQTNRRFYTLSKVIQKNRGSYYHVLERTQNTLSLDITKWLEWFLRITREAISDSSGALSLILKKHFLLQKIPITELNERQRKILDLLFNDFEGKLTTTKYAKITKTSQDTAGRDLTALIKWGILKRIGAGKNTHYILEE